MKAYGIGLLINYMDSAGNLHVYTDTGQELNLGTHTVLLDAGHSVISVPEGIEIYSGDKIAYPLPWVGDLLKEYYGNIYSLIIYSDRWVVNNGELPIEKLESWFGKIRYVSSLINIQGDLFLRSEDQHVRRTVRRTVTCKKVPQVHQPISLQDVQIK